MRRGVAVAALAVASCGTSGGGSPGTPEAEAPARTEVVSPSACVEIDVAGALTTFTGAACGWTLQPGTDAGVELLHATQTPTRATGTMPPPCEVFPCSVRGLETALGPLLVVEVGGADSEVPAGVWLGVVVADQLLFIDLWDEAGDVVVDDGISLGPAHALAPFDCEGTVALFAQARLPGAAAVPPPAPLRLREGAVAKEVVVARARCEPLAVGLP